MSSLSTRMLAQSELELNEFELNAPIWRFHPLRRDLSVCGWVGGWVGGVGGCAGVPRQQVWMRDVHMGFEIPGC